MVQNTHTHTHKMCIRDRYNTTQRLHSNLPNSNPFGADRFMWKLEIKWIILHIGEQNFSNVTCVQLTSLHGLCAWSAGGGDTGSQTETGLKQVRIRSILTFVFSVYKEGFNNRPTYTQSQY